jgi:hypothetical protein
MKYRINLASQPYENARRFYRVWGLALIAAALFTAAMVYAAVAGWQSAHGVRDKITAERQTLKKLDAQEASDLAILDKPENRDVRDRSAPVNLLIRRKEFSWTRIFADLEKLMPPRLHVVSLTPVVNDANEIELRMQVAGDSRDKAIELVQRMEKSKDFRHAQIMSEFMAEAKSGPGDTVQFEIAALYVPPVQAQPEGGQ